MKIRFENVGVRNWCGVVEVENTTDPDRIAELAYREAVKHLASRFPETDYDGETNEGNVYAGRRIVGRFSVLDVGVVV